MEERQIRDCLLPAASNQQNLTRVMPAQPNQGHAMQIGTTGFGRQVEKRMTLLLNRPDFECHLWHLWCALLNPFTFKSFDRYYHLQQIN